ncbi:nitrite reductase (NAD(P)H) small subunit [Streptomyces sp. NPDC020607]|uniref:nitrite reductase (NAD(P)H) small subunit n=1 Tax=Streptomyces sp. NPDC020607 TaxID=3365082 RepID=UPI0037AD6F66
MTQNLVLIGHGMVGHRFLETLAERGALADPAAPDGPGWQVTVLAEEDRPAYDRVHLSSAFTGATDAELALCATEAALFKDGEGRVYAVGNRDPFSGADVIAHGILGTRDGRTVVASPMYKQEFDLLTGECLDDPSVRLPVHEV